MTRANLNGVDISEASLTKANLSEANLSGANLSGARISFTNFSGANLRRANLSGALCFATLFAGLDLSDVQGLESVLHFGPSSVGIETVLYSKGNIPREFLRGCGVPENVIEYLPSLISSIEPIQFYSCFISYSSKNHDFAERLHADLQAKGVRTWFDQEHLRIGDKIRYGIAEAIRVHDKVVLVLSEQSISSDWVEGEVEAALERERKEKRIVLFPLRLDDAVMETPVGWASHIRQTRQIGDFRGWENHRKYKQAFVRLLRDLRSAGTGGANAMPTSSRGTPH
jgi:TIR domain/Pentapeptide repeats (8 copies)